MVLRHKESNENLLEWETMVVLKTSSDWGGVERLASGGKMRMGKKHSKLARNYKELIR